MNPEPPPKPFKTKHAELYLGDALPIVQSLKSQSIDLLLTDPPYGVAYQSGKRINDLAPILNDKPEDQDQIQLILQTAFHKLSNNRHAYSFGVPVNSPKSIAQTQLIWDKGNKTAGNLSLPFGQQHETIHFHVYSTNKSGGNLTAKLRKGTVLSFNSLQGTSVSKHPTQKPLKLLQSLIESSSLIGDTILDPFAGSGSTAVAAILSNRKVIAIELDQTHYETAKQRIIAAELIRTQMDQS